MIRTQIYLPDDIYNQLKLIAANSKLNFSQLIRNGVKKVISDHKPKFDKSAWLKMAGSLKTDIKTNAVQDIQDYYLH